MKSPLAVKNLVEAFKDTKVLRKLCKSESIPDVRVNAETMILLSSAFRRPSEVNDCRNEYTIFCGFSSRSQFDRAFHTDTRDLDVRRRNDGVIYVAHVFGEMRDEPGFEAGDSTIELTDSDLISKDSPNLELQIDELIRISHRAQNTMYETLPLQQQN